MLIGVVINGCDGGRASAGLMVRDSAGITLVENGGLAGRHRMLGTVEMPGDLMVQQIGRDFVLGYAWDELEVEYMDLDDLIKPQADPARTLQAP